MISVKVLFFGEACQLVGKRDEAEEIGVSAPDKNDKRRTFQIEFPEETDYEEIRRIVLKKYPALEKIEKVMLIAVDQEYAHPGDRFELERFTELAIIPPLSGG